MEITIEMAASIAAIVSSFAVIASLLYLGKQIKMQSEIHRQNHEWNRRIETQKALDVYSRLESVVTLNKKFEFMQKKHAIPCEEILIAVEDGSMRVHVARLLSYYENLSNGVALGIYDESIIKSARRTVMITTHEAFSAYMDYERKERNPLAYTQFRTLIDKWKKEARQAPALSQLGELDNT